MGDAGANHLGYFTGVWGPGNGAIVAHGFTGALHMWRREEHRWQPQASGLNLPLSAIIASYCLPRMHIMC